MRHLILFPLFIIFISCAHLRVSFEEKAYHDTQRIMKEALGDDLIAKCQFNLDKPRPSTYANPFMKRGVYFRDTQSVVYPSRRFNSLIHEYTHYLTDTDIKGFEVERCQREAIAQLTAYSAKLKKAIKRLEDDRR